MAAAIGAGLPVAEAQGSMVVDIGGGTSEVAVISLGGIVSARSVRVGGDKFDDFIIQYIKKKYYLLIGERTAEEIKIKIGSAYPYEDEQPITIKGRNLADGLPKNIEIYPEEIREALADPLASVIDAIKGTLEKTPPELSADIIDNALFSPAAARCSGVWTSWWSGKPAFRCGWLRIRWTVWHWVPVWYWRTWMSSGKCWTMTTARCKRRF